MVGLERLSIVELLHKIEELEILAKAIKKELNMRINTKKVDTDNDLQVLIRIKGLWDRGMRSESSSRGNYFRSSDVQNYADGLLIDKLISLTCRKEPNLDTLIGYALSSLKDKIFTHEGSMWYLERYVVNGTSAYRFVETE